MAKEKQSKLDKYKAKGWEVESQSEMYVTVRRPKRFSIMWFLFWTILTGIGGLIYVIIYLAKDQWVRRTFAKQ